MIASAVAGFTTCFVLIAAIGAQNAFVLRQGLRREHVLAVLVTCVASDALLIAGGIAGVGALVARIPSAVTVARWAGAVFLLGYAVLAARRAMRPASLTASTAKSVPLASTIGTLLALTYLNPHVYLDIILLGALAGQYDHRWLFGLGAALASLAWFASLGIAAHRLAPLLARPKAWRVLDGGIAAMMAVLAVGLVTA